MSRFHQPPRWYSPYTLPRMTRDDLTAYDRANARYLATVCDDVTWLLLVGWRDRATAGQVGGAQDGQNGCGGANPQLV